MRKWMAVGLGLVVATIISAGAYVLATALRSEHPVGFQTVAVEDPKGAPLQVGIWYPTKATTWPTLTGLLVQFVARDAPVDGTRHPLIILSHGIAGSLSSHADTALALADAGFIVAAPLHTGDNYKDQSAVGTTNWFVDRARHVHLTISYMLETWRDHGRIDDTKIGIFGFSAGGTTALIATGGMPDLGRIKSHCAKSNEFACQVWKSKKATAPDSDAFVHDPRIKAAVVIAPGAGFAFARYGLTNVRVPVQLWGAEKDESVPTPSNAEVVRRELGQRAEWHLVTNAAHFSFMVPCGPAGLVAPKLICSDPEGFDRGAFHREFNRQVVAFFKKKLAEAPDFICPYVVEFVGVCFPLGDIDGFEAHGMSGSYDAFSQKVPKYGLGPSDRLGFKIDVQLQDFITEYSRIRLDSACSKSWCFYFRKVCDLSNTTCTYIVFKPVRRNREGQRIMTGIVLDVRAHSDEAFNNLQKGVQLSAGLNENSEPEYVALEKLNHASPDLQVATCDWQKQSRGCQPPLLTEPSR